MSGAVLVALVKGAVVETPHALHFEGGLQRRDRQQHREREQYEQMKLHFEGAIQRRCSLSLFELMLGLEAGNECALVWCEENG